MVIRPNLDGEVLGVAVSQYLVSRPAYLRNVVISIFFFLALYVGFRFLR